MDGISTLKPSGWMEIVVISSYPRVLIYNVISIEHINKSEKKIVGKYG
jgi:hypothetical protein